MAALSELVEVGFTWDGQLAPREERAFVTLERQRGGLHLTVEAPYHGDPAPDAPVGSTDGLWNHEVVEVFVTGLAPAGQPVPYLEVELSPHGHHLVLDLLGVRQRIRTREELDYRATLLGTRWCGEAFVPWQWLPSRPNRFNVYAIHGEGERRRYLAMTPVPGPQPDFHRLERFTAWPF
ncbi:MAG: hypothetical protein H6736_22945 [Alphaproteobacteria bacterium]|nr:hypothetical protein [Alphaproteobacteria bacterium]MCB9694679.1 hypothetical protein [Alphaproteobacteria bacterium]